MPGETIPGAYNVTFKDLRTQPIGTGALAEQVRSKGLDRFERVLVLGGRIYTRMATAAFEGTRASITAPFEGMDMFQSLRAAKQAVIVGRRP